MTQALEGIRVLDFTQGMAGPLATMILADFGAEVVRVEPSGGDPMWSRPEYLMWNRGKKSVELDLTSPEGQEQIGVLVDSSDVLIESLRPGEAARLGIGYDAVAARNPSLVYFSLSAFGQEGPYKDLKAYDGIVNAKSGRMRELGGHYEGRPIYRAVNDTSFHTAMFAVQGIMAALRVAWTTGRGQHVDTSLLRGITAPNNAFQLFEGQELPQDREIGPSAADAQAVLRGELTIDRREADLARAIPSQLCTECEDGRWIMHSHTQVDLFQAWIKTIGFDWIWDDPRYKGAPTSFAQDEDRVELNRLLAARMKEKTSSEWIEIYRANPDCVGEIMQTTQEALRHPQFLHNGHLVEIDDPRVGRMQQLGPLVRMSETPAVLGTPAPFPGQHTEEILAGTGTRRPPEGVGATPAHPLEGIVMLELAGWLASPWAGALLGDLGADVIKIEPLTGDPWRRRLSNENMVRCMQGKRSLAVDLKTEAGQEILQRLIANADILMHNYRPGVPDRLGFDYETASRRKPGLVYLYAGSYGSTGPDSRRAAFNPTMGAFAGNSVFQSGEGNNPIGDQSPDPISGSAVATALMLGLAARLRTGEGQYLETTMMNSVVYCNLDDAFDYEGKPPRRNPDHFQLGLEATYRLYPTRDGWVFFAAPNDDEFKQFCATIDRDDLAKDERFSTAAQRYEYRSELGELLEPIFTTMSADDWELRLTAADVGCVRADGAGHKRFLHEDPHCRTIGFMVRTQHWMFASQAPEGKYRRHGPQVNFSETPCEAGKPFVACGEHTREILQELGYSDDEIRSLKEADVVGWPANADAAVGASS